MVDDQSSRLNLALGYSPCLTRARGGGGGHWLLWLASRMSSNQMVALVGLAPARTTDWGRYCGSTSGSHNALLVGRHISEATSEVFTGP